MPKLADFSGATQIFINQVVAAAGSAVKETTEYGADYMRKFIAEGSPTGSTWHQKKNTENGYPSGSRMGNANPSVGPVQENPGNMYRSVSAMGPATAPDKSKIVGLFGWIDADKNPANQYFVDQDTGNYHTGKHMGMGLLNGRTGDSRGVLQKFGAMVAAQGAFETAMKSAGFTRSGGSEFF
jgi:hypothetical protein